MKKSFTLIEILVVATIIALLAGGGAVVYTQLNINARDAKRKTDLEQIRAALEMYRSNSNDGKYPIGNGIDTLSILVNNKYIQRIPKDPVYPDYTYFYRSDAGIGYTLAAQLETNSSCNNPVPPITENSCGTKKSCNYCLGPYGQK